jgi:23S rRNA pseudouridine2605 synthase
MQERLQKIIAQAGIASRRAAERLIADGRVRINGQVVRTLGTKANPSCDRIDVEGYGRAQCERRFYLALHKPVAVVSTVSDPEGRRTVIDVVDEQRALGGRVSERALPRLFPIGRLDFDAEGLILLTNDGELAHQLMHPSGHVPKTYLVKVKGVVEEGQIERLRAGVRLRRASGTGFERRTMPADVRIFKESARNTWIEMTLFEGRNHQVKRMCEAVGLWVIRLVRTQFAGVSIDPLPAGAWRHLSANEVTSLQRW